MKSIKQRLNNILGQIEGVKRMVDEDKDCMEILVQLKAIKSGVAGVMDEVMSQRLESCMKSLKEKDKKLLINFRKYVKSN